MRTIDNPERGCGRLKEGGTYLRGEMRPDGNLQTWVWALGQHVMGGNNLAVSVPPRQMQVINLPATLVYGKLATEPVQVREDSALAHLPQHALIDHVGSSFYAPLQFADEVMMHGPSRRVPKDIGRAIAPYVPIPIVFTHADLPMVDKAIWEDVIAWAIEDTLIEPDKLWKDPTFWHSHWGLTTGCYRGHDHWLLPLLRRLESAGKGDNPLRALPLGLRTETLCVEQVFGISWITSVVYVATGDEDEETINDLLSAGVEPVIAGDADGLPTEEAE